jgi:hypothetical protein
MSTLRHLPVLDLKEHFKLTTFVETGTFEGDGLQHAVDCGFDLCFSCDLCEEFVVKANERFAKEATVYISAMDSVSFLKTIPECAGPRLYWLDAHQPSLYGLEETEATRFPVIQELEVIKQRKGFERDVIMIDDLIVIQGSPRWHEGEVCKELQIKNVDWNILSTFFIDTHDVMVFSNMEGILLFTPREG